MTAHSLHFFATKRLGKDKVIELTRPLRHSGVDAVSRPPPASGVPVRADAGPGRLRGAAGGADRTAAPSRSSR